METEDALKMALLGILVLSTVSSFFVAIANPEAHFFGQKLGGAMADAYLMANGCVGIVVAIAILRWEDKGRYLPIAFFGYNFVEILFTNIYAFDKVVVSPPALARPHNQRAFDHRRVLQGGSFDQ